MRIVLEDKQQYDRALDYIAKLSFGDAERILKKHGALLLAHEPRQTCDMLVSLCTPPAQRTAHFVSARADEPGMAKPEQLLPIFAERPEWLIVFIEAILAAERSGAQGPVRACVRVRVRAEDGSRRVYYRV